jgi:hypothetical protein
MRQIILCAAASLWLSLIAPPVQAAAPLDGKTYIVYVSSLQSDSGYIAYLLPPMGRAIARAGLKPAKPAPGADVVFNIVTDSDVGQWMEGANGREWLYTVTITIGISPESYVIPFEGTPQFGVAVSLITPNGDREDELACLIELATREAIARYQPRGLIKLSGQSCLRKT